jgi:hypothetical protein
MRRHSSKPAAGCIIMRDCLRRGLQGLQVVARRSRRRGEGAKPGGGAAFARPSSARRRAHPPRYRPAATPHSSGTGPARLRPPPRIAPVPVGRAAGGGAAGHRRRRSDSHAAPSLATCPAPRHAGVDPASTSPSRAVHRPSLRDPPVACSGDSCYVPAMPELSILATALSGYPGLIGRNDQARPIDRLDFYFARNFGTSALFRAVPAHAAPAKKAVRKRRISLGFAPPIAISR